MLCIEKRLGSAPPQTVERQGGDPTPEGEANVVECSAWDNPSFVSVDFPYYHTFVLYENKTFDKKSNTDEN